MNAGFRNSPFVAFRAATFVVLLLVALRVTSAVQLNSCGEKFTVLKAGSEVYSNVAVTLVTATDIYFTHSRGIGNAKLQDLDPELRSEFHFDAKKALEKENEQRQANARFDSWISQQTNNRPDRVNLAPMISVEAADPTVEYKYYSTRTEQDKPAYLPEEMTGNCACKFRCDIDLDIRPSRGTNGEPFAFRVETIKLSIGLPTTLTLPAGTTQKLRDHEEGHRQINEYFYSFGRKAAQRAIQVTLTNQVLNSSAKDRDSAESYVLFEAKTMVQEEYWKYTRSPSRKANVYYDQLTDHGRNGVDSTEAAEKAIQRYAVQIPDEVEE